MTVNKQILVKGVVQGVSYRKQTARVADHLGVRGWVRNVSNGSVEACLEGEEWAVDALIAWCAFGPKKGKVEEISILPGVSDGSYSGFSIREDRNLEYSNGDVSLRRVQGLYGTDAEPVKNNIY